MELITKQTLLERLPAKWTGADYRVHNGKLVSEIHKELISANPLTEEKAIEITGNPQVIANYCN